MTKKIFLFFTCKRIENSRDRLVVASSDKKWKFMKKFGFFIKLFFRKIKFFFQTLTTMERVMQTLYSLFLYVNLSSEIIIGNICKKSFFKEFLLFLSSKEIGQNFSVFRKNYWEFIVFFNFWLNSFTFPKIIFELFISFRDRILRS